MLGVSGLNGLKWLLIGFLTPAPVNVYGLKSLPLRFVFLSTSCVKRKVWACWGG